MSTANPNNRASLLAGLRTGGVRSSSLNVPHTAAPTGSFNVPRMASYNNPNIYYEEEEDQFVDLPPQQPTYSRAMPLTAAVDGPNNRFSQQQTRIMNPNSVPFSPGFAPNMMQQQQYAPQNAMQMQMLQIEMFKLQQALQVQQAQQLQAEMLAQAQRQQQLQAQAQARERRASAGYNPPATAGPMNQQFDLRSATLGAQQRRANQADQLRAQLGLGVQPDDQVPMTAALGGRFGSRTTSLQAPGAHVEENGAAPQVPPPTPGGTTVISGGTSLGAVQSKSDAASSWRRGGNNNSVLSGNRSVTSPAVKVTPPPIETRRISPPPGLPTSSSANGPKFRPQPLRFSAAVSQPIPAVTIDTTDDDTDADTHSSESSVKSSSPTTPRSSSSNEMPLSPREEASKKLYEGLGIGRPVSTNSSETQLQQYPTASVVNHRMVSQPTRQPRGPPSGTEELGPKNFASRIRRKAIGGLGALMDARERRDIIEAY
ncbi:hypothetical protein FA13DRAFT_1706758 [Coprinellus micaceus]|uniref:Uncharacterized protein n=1 Tax=Coprinellus micaceus TaxID=71717 RepID=A0A4Y7TPE8_COPMI|nr:hypothetical protein FA13DRAFT_1706758 [Coprinellus micaceus]